MKKLISILILTIFIVCICTGCDQEPQKELRDLPGYTLVSIGQDTIGQDTQRVNGYVKNDDLELCTKNKIETIKVLYPYKDFREEEFVVVKVESIRYIVVGY